MPYVDTADGCKIRYEVHGDGPTTLVLIHGQGGSYRNWDTNAPVLAASHGLRVITPEIRPHRFSEVPAGADYSMARIARDVLDVMDDVDVERAHVGGWSLGGLVAQQFAHDHPDRTASIGLVNTFADWRFGPWYRPAQFQLNILAIKAMGRMKPERIAKLQDKSIRTRLLKPETLAAHPQVCEDFIEDCIQNTSNPDFNRLVLGTTAEFNSRPWLPGMDLPALIVGGGEDHVPEYMTEDMWRLLPDAELHWWPGGTHMIPWDYADDFNATYAEFVRRVEADEFTSVGRIDH